MYSDVNHLINRCSISHENAMILTNIDTQENIFIHSCIVCTELKHSFFINIKYHFILALSQVGYEAENKVKS